MDELLLAYLAGCMDSDGYFTVRRDSRSMRSGNSKTRTHVAMVGLRQVTPAVPHLLLDTFGGHLSVTKSTAERGRDLHGWVASATKAAVACEALLPYLRLKGAQARALVELQGRKGAIRVPGTAGVQRVTEAELMARDELWTRVKTLNRVGI